MVESAVVSVESVAVNVELPVTDDLTVKVTTPPEVEVPEAVEIESLPLREDARVTVFPAIGFEFESMRVMVKVAVVAPSAGRVVALVRRVETV